MSRSFHITRKDLKDFRSKMSLNDEDHIEAYDKLCEQYARKRRTKAHIQSERKETASIPVKTDIDSLPIEFVCDSQYLHYPVTDKDIRNLLHMMPQGLVDGLSKVIFCSGTHHQEMPPEEALYAAPQRDPYMGRIGHKVVEDVYRGRCLGTYFCNRKVIRVYGYVYPPDVKLEKIVEFYLRIQILMVFLHELAHHYDLEHRVARGRWRLDNSETVEMYAEQYAHQWINEYALPYISTYHAEECAYLNNWMKQHIGVPLPLSLLAGDFRSTAKKGRIRICSFFNTADFFAEFIEKIQTKSDVLDARVELADGLHMSEAYDLALEILNPVLRDNSKNINALCVCGEVYWHLEDYPRAIQYAEKALSLHKQEIDAYQLLCDCYEGLKDWRTVIKWACCGLDFAETKGDAMHLLRSKAEAEIELNDLDQATCTIAEIKKFYNGLLLKPLEEKLKQKQRK